jgi:hypothetical protein
LNNPIKPDPVETARSYQLVASKSFHSIDLKLTLGHETQSAEYGKIDPDQGLQFDLGPGRIRYLGFTLRQRIPGGSLQATFEQADARLVNTSYSIVPEAPRLIGDLVGTYQKLPFRLAKGEFEYVGRKLVANGCGETAYLSGDPNALNYYCLGVANKEFRLAVARPFLEGRLNVGVNMMIASGWTGQTTENFCHCRRLWAGKSGLGKQRIGPGKSSQRSGWRKNSFLRQREYHLPLWQESCPIGGAPFFSNDSEGIGNPEIEPRRAGRP